MKDGCPAGCASGDGEGLRRTSASELKLTPLILAAAKMQEGDQILLCHDCGRVIRRSFDSYVLRFRLESIGTYVANNGRFEPKAWLQHEMERLTMLSPSNVMEYKARKEKND